MNRFIFVIVLATVVFVSACKKTTDLEAPRIFRPQKAADLIADSNTVIASWLKIAGAKNYILQWSRDTFKTIDASLTLDTNTAVVEKLLFNQLYQFQVKAVAADTTKSSLWSFLGAVRTLSSILKVPAPDDITFNSVRVRWTTKGSPVTSIKMVKAADNTTVSTNNLSAADVTNEFKVVGGLEAATKYIIYLYSGADERGYVDFTTKAPFAGTVIDLTNIVGRPSVLADTLPIVPAGSTILLKKGLTYNISSSYSFNKNLIITSAPDLSVTTQAKIFFTSNFNFAAGAVIDSIEFNDVFMYSDNYSSRYIFNNTNSATVGKLKFMNSRMEIFRGMVRLQSGAVNMNSFIIDNSIVDSIGNFAMLNISSSSKIENISLTRSTFYKTEGVIASSQTSTSVLIEDCTFNEAPLGNNNNAYVNYGSLNVAGGVTIRNSLFGVGKTSGSSVTIRGVKVGTSTVVSASNNYRTSDQVSGGNDIPNITTSNRTSLQLWQDPASGNFKIMDNAFPGRSTTGDPRWRL
jgi:hypothetical protein